VALGLANVRFLPLQEEAEFLQMLAAIDMGLIVQQATVSDIVFPSKTVTLLSAARPVGAAVSAESEIARVIRVSRGGVVVESESGEELAVAIREFLNDPDKRLAMGECGRQFALPHWEETRVLSSFEAHLLKTAGTPTHDAIAESPASI
jgi:colanic acid biosynthesis glycosyl transferase WcaI